MLKKKLLEGLDGDGGNKMDSIRTRWEYMISYKTTMNTLEEGHQTVSINIKL